MRSHRRRDHFTIEAEATVYIDEVLDEISDAELLEELARRSAKIPLPSLETIWHLLIQRKVQEAICEVEKLMYPPRVPSVLAYEKARETRDPVSGRPVIQ